MHVTVLAKYMFYKLHKKQNKFSEKYKDLGMACHTLPSKKSKKRRNKGKCHYSTSVPSHFKNVEYRDFTELCGCLINVVLGV